MFSLMYFQAQYEFLHELALAYIDSSEDYSNFKWGGFPP